MLPDKTDIAAAAERISGHIRQTPVIRLAAGDLVADTPVTLKLEMLQHTASFKTRGAFNALMVQDVPDSGVIAASGGNHGAAVAFAARALGHRAEIFVPDIIAPAKLERLRGYGAVVQVIGHEFAEAFEAAEARRAATGALSLHAYDQPEILAGQGSVALEWERQAPDLETLLVAVGGGGLIGGIACWTATAKRLIAVESETTATLHTALTSGEPIDVQVSGLAADSLGARRIGKLGFEAARRYGIESVLVSDAAIRDAQRRLWTDLRLVAEPGGATALAALLSGAYAPAAKERVGVLICGGNTDPAALAQALGGPTKEDAA